MNKKIVSGVLAAGMIAGTLVPMLALAQPQTGCTLRHDIEGFTADGCTSGTPVDETSNPGIWGICCIMDAVLTVTDWIFYGLLVVTALLVIWGGFTIATAGGSPDKVGEGRNYILYAMIGLAVALLSRAIPAVVRALIA
jgi:hypothetical protein